MADGLRIILASCHSRDPWTFPVIKDIHKVLNKLGHEMIFLGANNHGYPGDLDAIDLNHLKNYFFIRYQIGALPLKEIDLKELVEVDYKFCREKFHYAGIKKEGIQARMESWLNEALVLLKILQPDIVIVWNGMLSRRAVIVKAAGYLNVPVFYVEKGMLPESWYIDPEGVNAMSSVARSTVKYAADEAKIQNIKELIDNINKKGKSAWEQPGRKDIRGLREQLGIGGNKKVIFFPGQVESDSNIVFFSPHFETVLDAVRLLVKDLEGKDYFILVKPHPKSAVAIDTYREIVKGMGTVVEDINIFDAIELSHGVVSINSTVAFEAALNRKPVLLLGESVMSNKAFACRYIPTEPLASQIAACLERYQKNEDQYFREALSFAAYLHYEYYADRGDLACTEKLLRRTLGNTKPKVKMFRADEIVLPFKDISEDDLLEVFPGQMIKKAFFKKVKQKLLFWKK